MPLLPSTTNDFIFTCLSPLDLYNYSLSCKDAREDVSSYLRRAFSIHAFLSFYFSSFAEIERFRWIQKATGALIAGPSALEFFDRLHHDADKSSLEVFVQYRFASLVADYLESIGYRFIPSSLDASRPAVAGTRPSPSFSSIVKRDYHISLGLLQQSYTFISEAEIPNSKNTQKRRIQLRPSLQIPLEVILDRSYSTCYMNLISDSHAISLYPKAAFEHRLSVLLSRHVYLDNVTDEPEWKLLGYEDLTNHQLEHFFPNTVRRVGDEHCWIIPLPRFVNADEASGENQSTYRPPTSMVESAGLFDGFTSWSFYPHAGVKRIKSITWR